MAVLAGACGGGEVSPGLVERGAAIARNPSASRSQYNPFSCLTCHAERAADLGARVFPGAVLEGAARRPTYWGGETIYLREAVERCWVSFMRGDARDLDGPTGDALWAWLDALVPRSTAAFAAVPFTVPQTSLDLANGDATRGRQIFGRACANCHGAIGSAVVPLGRTVSRLPNDTVNQHCRGRPPAGIATNQVYLRMVVYQKTRHGGLLGYGGTMPPFSMETLSDAELADIVALFRCPEGS